VAEIWYRRHRFAPVVIQHAVWLYLRFTLGHRDVENLVAERGLDFSYETIRSSVFSLDRQSRGGYDGGVRGRATVRIWDEMVVRIGGELMYLWRAVDHEGEVLDMLVQRRRGCRAALRLMRKLLKKQGFGPKLLVSDKLKQLGWKLSSAGATTRAQDVALQVGSIGPALSQHARRLHNISTFNAISCRGPRSGSSVPRRRTTGKRPVAAGWARGLPLSPFRSRQLNLTVPLERPPPITFGAGKGYDSVYFVMELRNKAVTPDVA
jgi:transposase-like protein